MTFLDPTVLWWWTLNPLTGLLTASYYRYSPSSSDKLFGYLCEVDIMLSFVGIVYAYLFSIPNDRCYNTCGPMEVQIDAEPQCCNDGNNPLSASTNAIINFCIISAAFNALRWIWAIVPFTRVRYKIALKIFIHNRFVLRRSLLASSLDVEKIVTFERIFLQSMISSDSYLFPKGSIEDLMGKALIAGSTSQMEADEIIEVAEQERASAQGEKKQAASRSARKNAAERILKLKILDQRNSKQERLFLRSFAYSSHVLKDPEAASALSTSPITGLFMWAHMGYAMGWHYTVLITAGNTALLLWHFFYTRWWELLAIVLLDGAAITLYAMNVLGGKSSAMNIVLSGMIRTRNVVAMRRWASKYVVLSGLDGKGSELSAEQSTDVVSSISTIMRTEDGSYFAKLRTAVGRRYGRTVRDLREVKRRDASELNEYMVWFSSTIGELEDNQVYKLAKLS